jgi:iron complex outermembrane receptor protein
VLQAKLDDYVALRDISQPDYSGNQLPLAPHVSGSVLLQYTVPLPSGTLTLQGNANYKSHVFFDVSNDPYIQQSGYWIGNLRAAYAFAEHWEAGAYVHNVADKQYYVDKFNLTNPFGFIEGIIGTPRIVGVELNWRY